MEAVQSNLKEFMDAWKKQDYDTMHSLTTQTYRVGHTAKELEEIMNHKITSFKISDSKESTEVVYDTDIEVRLKGMKKSAKAKQIKARSVQELKPFMPSNTGAWGVNPISMLKGLN